MSTAANQIPVDSQILAALKALLEAADVGCAGVHVGRSEADPFESDELPAVNLLPVEEDVSTDGRFGSAVGCRVLQAHGMALVVQVITRGGSAAEAQARLISAQAQAAIASDPTLGGRCSQTMYMTAKQWLRDDGNEQRIARQNTLYRAAYRTWSDDPFTPA